METIEVKFTLEGVGRDEGDNADDVINSGAKEFAKVLMDLYFARGVSFKVATKPRANCKLIETVFGYLSEDYIDPATLAILRARGGSEYKRAKERVQDIAEYRHSHGLDMEGT